ncbi:MAG: hypothetical protein KGL43_14655, partial [Burkholderiales bacterium]|nr:hypothetical protein [Burkholderiales bacterium]
ALAQFMKVSLAGQHVFARALAGLYVRLDLPSRTELAALAAAVQRVEDKVDVLLPPAPSLAPRPARTRRAPTPAPAVAADVSPKVARTIQKPASAKRSAAKPTTSRARTTKRQAA